MIRLIKKYPYDNNYDYIKLFDTKTKQENYFNSFKQIIISDEDMYEGYIKEGQTFIINYNYDFLVNENVNYLIYDNGYKIMYCFIIQKEYVDEENTRLIYEVDVMNTFCFDFNLRSSFVERKVCSIDEVSDYDEGIELGEHIIEENNKCFNKEYTFFSMWKGFNQQFPTFKENGEMENILTVPFMSIKPYCNIDDVQYPVFFAPMLSYFSAPVFEQEYTPNTGAGEIIGEGILPSVTNSLGTFMLPTTGTITALYPYYPSGGAHTGIDIANVEGTKIYASAPGTVTVINKGDLSFGLYIRIDHSNGTSSFYCHMSKTIASTGDTVAAGQLIGLMGSTGNSSGNHTHWEIRNASGQHVHPYPDGKLYSIIKRKED